MSVAKSLLMLSFIALMSGRLLFSLIAVIAVRTYYLLLVFSVLWIIMGAFTK